MSFAFVAFGGAVGAILRYAISLLPYKGMFPILTLVTNVFGALIIGFIAGTASRKNLSENAVLFLKTGVCGGFTTFSTFSLEAYELFKNGEKCIAIIYIILSVSLCLIGIYLGTYLSKKI